jgi:hypothetical protein
MCILGLSLGASNPPAELSHLSVVCWLLWQKLNAVFVSYLSVIVPDLSIAGDGEEIHFSGGNRC